MSSYELIDSGDFCRLERFGEIVINRPAPQAEWPRKLHHSVWDKADLCYHRNEAQPELSAWINSKGIATDWPISIHHIQTQLSLSTNGQIGIFPEQEPNWLWLDQIIKEVNRPLQLLNGFAHTGLATAFAAKAAPSVRVCHVDGAASAIKRAKLNAELNSTPENSVRWIVDDVNTFLKREIKRGQRYDGIILDPPAFGRGKGFTWKFEKDFPVLLDCVDQLLSANPLFVMISCHVPGLTASQLLAQCETGLNAENEAGRRAGRPLREVTAMDLTIPSTKGNPLPSGICVRFKFS